MTIKNKFTCHKCDQLVPDEEVEYGIAVESEYAQFHKQCGGEVTDDLANVKPAKHWQTITHALVIPWRLGASSDIVTWCARTANDAALANHLIASSPEAITCPHCIRGMKLAHQNLSEWVPRLRKEKC